MSFSFQARAKYLHVAKQMKAYEDQLYEQWKESVEHILPGLLRRNLLVKPTVKEVAPEEMEDVDKEAGKEKFILKSVNYPTMFVPLA